MRNSVLFVTPAGTNSNHFMADLKKKNTLEELKYNNKQDVYLTMTK